jgi:chemotaxis protein MotB
MKSSGASRSSGRKSKPRAEIDADGTWAISYGDMITLLLTFFIIFFSMDKGKDRSKALEESLVEHLRMELANPTSTPAEKKMAVSDSTRAPASAQTAHVDEQLLKDLGARIDPVGAYILVDFPGVSFYDFRKIDLTKEGTKALQKFARAFVPYAGHHQLVIRSFTDDKPVRNLAPGTRAYRDNMELSALRAVATARVLQKAGVPLDKIKPSGFGPLRLPAKVAAKLQDGAKPDGKEGTHSLGTPLARKVVLIIEPENSKTNSRVTLLPI